MALLRHRLLTYCDKNLKSIVGTQTVMIFIMKPQRQQSDRDLCRMVSAYSCISVVLVVMAAVCSVAADGCCTNGAVLTEGTTCVQ